MGYEWSGFAWWKHLFFSLFLREWRIKVVAICLELNDEIQIFVNVSQFSPEGQHVCFPECFGKIPPHILQLLEHFVPQWPAVSLCPVSRCVCVCVCIFRGPATQRKQQKSFSVIVSWHLTFNYDPQISSLLSKEVCYFSQYIHRFMWMCDGEESQQSTFLLSREQ